MSVSAKRLGAIPMGIWLLCSLLAGPAAAQDRGLGKHAAEGQDRDRAIYQALKGVINTGSDLYNQSGDAAGCYRLYQGGLLALRPLLGPHPDMQRAIDTALADAEQQPTFRQRAFALNRTLRDLRAQLKPQQPGKSR
jgi:hypothetical protein